MIDPSYNEQQAMQSVLRPLGDYVASIGLQIPLAQYSRSQILNMIDIIVTSYQAQLQKMPPIEDAFLNDDIPF